MVESHTQKNTIIKPPARGTAFPDIRTLMSPQGRTSGGGFTLVETLVAISILLLVVIGPITVAQKGIQNAHFANEQMTAIFLAQEALEAVREGRDGFELRNITLAAGETKWTEWFDDFGGNRCVGNLNGCGYGGGNFAECDSGMNACRLEIDSDGKYVVNGATESPFTRKVYLQGGADTDSDGTPDSISVRVNVTWNSRVFGNTERSVELETWIYDRYND